LSPEATHQTYFTSVTH